MSKPGVPFRSNDEYYRTLSRIYSKAIVEEMVQKSMSGTAEVLLKYSRSMYRNTERRDDLARMHKNLAAEAQQKVIQKYNSRKTAGRRSYRENETNPKLRRYSGKRLEQALKSKNLIVTNATGIGMYDMTWLDKKARQWYRMNFGALPKTTAVVGEGSMKMLGQSSSKKLTLRNYGPSKQFWIPNSISMKGLWSNKFLPKTNYQELSKQRANMVGGKSGEGAFYVVGKGKGKNGKSFRGSFDPRISSGIEGSRFLDSGISYVNNEYGPRIRDLFMSWHKDALSSTSSGGTKTVKVKGNTPIRWTRRPGDSRPATTAGNRSTMDPGFPVWEKGEKKDFT